jgi:hypothetical protein
VNEHLVDLRGDCDAYALVVIEDLDPRNVIFFRRTGLAEVCTLLGKRHPDQDCTLQFTRRNYLRLLDLRASVEHLGVQVFDLAAPTPG